MQNQLGKDAVVVTIFSDDNKKYLSTDLLKCEPVKDNFLSTDIELANFNSFKRVCHTCCDPKNCVEASYALKENCLELPYCPRRGCN